jgi:hypothetical protein
VDTGIEADVESANHDGVVRLIEDVERHAVLTAVPGVGHEREEPQAAPWAKARHETKAAAAAEAINFIGSPMGESAELRTAIP